LGDADGYTAGIRKEVCCELTGEIASRNMVVVKPIDTSEQTIRFRRRP
jgi:hypothetical protein